MNLSFIGRNIIVTGAARGIGQGITKKLLECGAKVIAVDREKITPDDLNLSKPCQLQSIAVDLNDWDLTKKALQSNVERVDGLVNNAGVVSLESFLDVSPDQFDRCFSVNVRAALNVSQTVAKRMIANGADGGRRGGSIVNMSSQAALIALPDHSVYCATKAALDALTRVAALELGPHGIRVNSVNPTVTETALAKQAWSDPAKRAAMLAAIPLGRFCEIEDVVNVVLFLLSDESAMINGVSLPVDGGFTAT